MDLNEKPARKNEELYLLLRQPGKSQGPPQRCRALPQQNDISDLFRRRHSNDERLQEPFVVASVAMLSGVRRSWWLPEVCVLGFLVHGIDPFETELKDEFACLLL